VLDAARQEHAVAVGDLEAIDSAPEGDLSLSIPGVCQTSAFGS
jgi:hypothetical protein